MNRTGTLPMIRGTEEWELIEEPQGWRIFLNWAGAVRVFFHAEVKAGLPWKFWPVQDVVLARPGETLQAFYRAKNLSRRSITAKARHLDEPKGLAAKSLEIIQCFLLYSAKPATRGRDRAAVGFPRRLGYGGPGAKFQSDLPVFSVGSVPQEVELKMKRFWVWTILLALGVAGTALWMQSLSSSSGTGILEVRVKDHREAIDDFETLQFRVEVLRLSPKTGLKSTDPGWKELALIPMEIDLTRYKGDFSVRIFRGDLEPSSFQALHLKIGALKGKLRKPGASSPLRNRIGPVRLPFLIFADKVTLIVLDLVVLDLSDHPSRGYELHLKGYELYVDGKLADRVPPA